ncbi:MAG: DUF2911 domain-containing protein [Puniceicoccaceae bacterium]|nr:MAG: DUF2911 domain-containing protein [Puniceicoccaceae bacterium]
MKFPLTVFSMILGLGAAGIAQAQIQTPAASPRANLSQSVGLTTVTVDYSRPSARDREIYGALVPFGEIWRTGADAATRIVFEHDVTFGGESVDAGEYALYSIPGENEWTIILYTDTSHWGAQGYDPANEVVRVPAEPQRIEPFLETFLIGLEHLRDDSAVLHLDWAHTRVPVKITTDTNTMVEASIAAALENPDALGPRDYARAAIFYLNQGRELEQAKSWMEKALEASPDAYWWEHSYARILAEQGEKEAAIAAAEASLEKARATGGRAFGYIDLNEALIKRLQN